MLVAVVVLIIFLWSPYIEKVVAQFLAKDAVGLLFAWERFQQAECFPSMVDAPLEIDGKRFDRVPLYTKTASSNLGPEPNLSGVRPEALQDHDSSNSHSGISGDDGEIDPEGPEPEPDPESDGDSEEDDEDDDVPYHTAHVYFIDGYIQVAIDEISVDTRLEQISDFMQLRYREAKACHFVGAPPSDHNQEEVIILELAADEAMKPLESDVLLLVDVEFRFQLMSSEDDTVRLRKVLWLRASATRISLLFQLRCYELCGRENFGCVVFHNHHHWSEHDFTVRNFLYGDFLRLVVLCPAAVPPSTVALEMKSFEERECMRRVFKDSPEDFSEECGSASELAN